MIYAQTWDVLEQVVDAFGYVDKSRLQLVRDDESNYAVLYAFITTENSYVRGQDRHTRHEFVVPVATYDRANWARWVFERLVRTAVHEVCEWATLDGERLYPPHHGDGEDPYVEWHLGTLEQAAKAPGDA